MEGALRVESRVERQEVPRALHGDFREHHVGFCAGFRVGLHGDLVVGQHEVYEGFRERPRAEPQIRERKVYETGLWKGPLRASWRECPGFSWRV